MFSDDAASVSGGSYMGAAGRLGFGYSAPGTPHHLNVATTPEPKSPAGSSTFSYVSDTGPTNSGAGLGMGRIGSSSGTQSPMHRQVSYRRALQQNSAAAAGGNYELVSPGTSSPSRFPLSASPPRTRHRPSNTSLRSTPPPPPLPTTSRQQSALEVPSPTASSTALLRTGTDLTRPVSLLRHASSGNRSPSAVSPTNMTGSEWPRPPPPPGRDYSSSEAMSRTESVHSAVESPSGKVSVGGANGLTRRESSPSVIELNDAASSLSRQGVTTAPVLGPPV